METHHIAQPSPWMILPFILLLLTIAVGPLFFEKWWHRHYPKVSFSLGLISLIYYVFVIKGYVRLEHTAMEYVSFIALVGSLFVVGGGIHINVKGESTPLANVIFLLVGAVIANVLGTTGASMLLIRPWIRMNRYRITTFHVVFFIFIISNVGGCLTPIGDPPLFLGYLKGIPFWWVAEHLWMMWIVGVGLLLLIFFVIDYRNYLKAPREIRAEVAEPPEEWRFEGGINILYLAMILGAVFITHPPFVREIIMIIAAVGSYYSTSQSVHRSNDFNFFPIIEVTILFAGIFATMMPALDWLELNARNMGETSPGIFYWGTGLLSGVLDNAPTYLSFLSAAFGALVDPAIIQQVQEHIKALSDNSLAPVTGPNAQAIKDTIFILQKYNAAALASGDVSRTTIEIAYLLSTPVLYQYIQAISIGAVFFGAFTYIGNAPNFMVKSIAGQAKVHAPTFLGYVFKYSIPILLPVLILVWLIFFRT